MVLPRAQWQDHGCESCEGAIDAHSGTGRRAVECQCRIGGREGDRAEILIDPGDDSERNGCGHEARGTQRQTALA